MAVTLTVSQLGAAIRLGESTEETADVTRLLAYATEAVARHLGRSFEDTPDEVANEAVIRLAAYLYDQPNAGRGIAFANALRNSGAAAMLLPYRVHRAGVDGAESTPSTPSTPSTTTGAGLTPEDRALLDSVVSRLDALEVRAAPELRPNNVDLGKVLSGGSAGRPIWDLPLDVLLRAIPALTGQKGKRLTVSQSEDGIVFEEKTPAYTLPAAAADKRGGVQAVTNAIIDADTSTGIFGWSIAHVRRLVEVIVPAWARAASPPVSPDDVADLVGDALGVMEIGPTAFSDLSLQPNNRVTESDNTITLTAGTWFVDVTFTSSRTNNRVRADLVDASDNVLVSFGTANVAPFHSTKLLTVAADTVVNVRFTLSGNNAANVSDGSLHAVQALSGAPASAVDIEARSSAASASQQARDVQHLAEDNQAHLEALETGGLLSTGYGDWALWTVEENHAGFKLATGLTNTFEASDFTFGSNVYSGVATNRRIAMSVPAGVDPNRVRVRLTLSGSESFKPGTGESWEPFTPSGANSQRDYYYLAVSSTKNHVVTTFAANDRVDLQIRPIVPVMDIDGVARIQSLTRAVQDIIVGDVVDPDWEDVNTDGSEGGVARGAGAGESLDNAEGLTYAAPSVRGNRTFVVVRIPKDADPRHYRTVDASEITLHHSLSTERLIGTKGSWRYYEFPTRLDSSETLTLQIDDRVLGRTTFDGVLGPKALASIPESGGDGGGGGGGDGGGFPTTRTEVLSASAGSSQKSLTASENWIANQLYELVIGNRTRHLFVTTGSGNFDLIYHVPDQAGNDPNEPPYFFSRLAIGAASARFFSLQEVASNQSVSIKINKLT